MWSLSAHSCSWVMVMMFMLTTVDFNDDADDDDAEGKDAEGENAEGEDAEDDEENDNWMQPAGSQNWAKQHVPGDFTLVNFLPITIHHHHHFGLVIVLLSFPLLTPI